MAPHLGGAPPTCHPRQHEPCRDSHLWKLFRVPLTGPRPKSVRRYLEAEDAAGTARLDDAETAATQFLGMISNYVFWPRMLLARWEPDEAGIAHAVDQAVLTMLARYGAPETRGA
ncbi:TetR/AcrR family transcriptional regulator C-terminal domain-containing protein [Nocardiopsis sp. RSe5-2]|uniref:TetR/AcrR family transcriptional regulator C-terminal domain-containing protein n=1 Tax=Nocardiopsis endophytica TaxID=3018445 RepID=A0ABT4U3N9_9ACTN|nr:TetR/AcrR family transcriptional regulator C-terminal domain-containing protein [Nocardiopsis endophytica]MDA2811578.1 TetR/AcrR family transcriptional regulator C-terminal domain-containing protein [Nocardiopsis endophytica]